ncbi:hypothetical protein Cgig2_002210 [Carnegiea gigantea]|uniref:SHSP domain-containing protein n=1 Tax=Carnegiea gigantea TaxID=171969 RepID=A0A9Q1GZG4_9CARY|nr:hypothetical protein Cgig2_002210 [Carnegiea gigantea]
MVPPPPLISSMQPCIRSRIEYKETPKAHLFMVGFLGLKKEGMKVHVDDGNVLHISAKSKHEMGNKKNNYYRHIKRGFGEFVSSFKLPHNARPELRRTCAKNGFLTVTVPKEKYTYSSGLENTEILERSNNSFAILSEQLNKHSNYVDSEDCHRSNGAGGNPR